MARQAQNNAQKTYTAASDLTGGSQSNANSLYNNLFGQYSNQATNPVGFTPTEKADMTTASEQSAGGALGAATGKGAQYAAANKNSGSFAPVLDESARNAMRTLSNNSLKVNNEDAMLKEAHRQQGLEGENRLFNTENNDVLSSLGLQTNANNSLIDAGKSGWFQNMLGMMNALQGAGAKTASGAAFTL